MIPDSNAPLFVVLVLFFSFLKCPVEDGVQRNSAALENGGKSAPRPILMFIRVSCVFGPDHKQNNKTGTDLSICPGSLLGLLAMTEGGLKPQRNHRFRRAQNPTHRILRVSITETSWAPLCSYQKHPCLTPTPGAPRPARGFFLNCFVACRLRLLPAAPAPLGACGIAALARL